MQRYGSVVRLRPERQDEYLRLHADVWPAVLAQISRSNITNFSIFLRDGYLFSYYEYVGEDFAADMAAMAADSDTRRWWAITDACQERLDTAAAGEQWAPMTEVFHHA
ncbi:L-rhamnose mutarotase [Microbacterium rhizosphaerae]|uniref:L-rhamnose mutarotase n=1 Tax=Microbacterium rhizosphaerae TaxID=1678237 RepID=A0ABZ0SJQ7_9MICO|nr:L-rhamnose mutarotase [Microbacterium rhizosphaerae]WPR89124.1 L-rhamnose mutarotase [Microbacterium rhizosphaerae]